MTGRDIGGNESVFCIVNADLQVYYLSGAQLPLNREPLVFATILLNSKVELFSGRGVQDIMIEKMVMDHLAVFTTEWLKARQ